LLRFAFQTHSASDSNSQLVQRTFTEAIEPLQSMKHYFYHSIHIHVSTCPQTQYDLLLYKIIYYTQ